jgi:hypothetical protein
MNRLIILDDVFDDDTRSALAAFDYGDGEQWYALGASLLPEKIIDICREHFDLRSVVGYEMWRNASNPGWHVDKDEKLFSTTKRLDFPLCSAVYYATIENLVGGEFYTDDMRCLPKTNRLILFSPGIYHGVSPFAGTRIAVSLNPWSRKVER